MAEALDPRWPLVKGRRFDPGGVELGGPDDLFPGTDRLSMAVSPQAVEWLARGNVFELIVGEGQRLGTPKFLSALARSSRLRVIYLDPPRKVSAARRAARGTVQDPQWVRGSFTKADNAALHCRDLGVPVLRITDPGATSEDLAGLVGADLWRGASHG